MKVSEKKKVNKDVGVVVDPTYFNEIPVDGMKATQIMVVFDVQSKRTAHSIANRGFYIVNYTKLAMCPGEIDLDDAYRIANWWLYKKLGRRLPHWAEPEDMIQDAVTRLIEREGRPPDGRGLLPVLRSQRGHGRVSAAQPKTRARG
jgi:hypothetical protein